MQRLVRFDPVDISGILDNNKILLISMVSLEWCRRLSVK